MDWLSFFDDHQIDYVTRGPNVKKGNVNIACPMCGDDPSHHMGVALEKEAWGCWRGANHKGKKAHNLVRALLGCSFNQAKIIVQQYSAADPEDLDDVLDLMLKGYPEREARIIKKQELKFPDEFKRIKKEGSTKRFFKYLKNRGFKKVDKFCSLYKLRCATTGKFKDRIIIPIYQRKKLVGWTSRAIGKTRDAPRYLALSEDDGGLVNVFHTLWNWDSIMDGGDLLLIVEGPFDALKLDYYALELYNEGIEAQATCTFGTSMSEQQAMMLSEVARRFKKAVLLYDEGATEAIFRAKELLEHTKVECGFLPPDVEDPGEMTRKEVHNLIKGLLCI